MLLMPDPATANIDPFMDETTLLLTCDVIEPTDGKGYERDPRSLAKRAEAYLKSTGIGDVAYFGPEPEFFIFDSVEWSVDMSGSYCKVFSSGSRVVDGREVRRRQHGPSAHRKGRLLPGTAGRLAAGHPLGDVPRARSRWASRSKCITTKWRPRASAKSAPSSPRWYSAPTGLQILKYVRAQHRARLWQDRDVHAQADRRRQRLRDARAPVGVEGRQEPVRRRRLCRAVGIRAVLHRRHHQARQARSTRSPIPAPIPTSGWSPASRPRSSSLTRRATARRPSAFRT